MLHDVTLITTIAASLGLAFVLGFIAARLNLPVLLGYLVAGMMIGPATPGFVADMALSSQLAEIGVMLLMFGVGLHFSIDDLLAVRKIALPGAVLQIVAATLLGIFVAMHWGWSFHEGLVFGLALSVASTVVLLKALEQQGLLKSINGQIAVGWLVVEDLVMVLVLVLLPSFAPLLTGESTTGFDYGVLLTLFITLSKIAVFVALMLIVGRRFFPWLLWQVAKIGSQELFTLCVISAAVGIAYGSASLFGVSFALGAFFAGMVMRESHLSHRAAEGSLPLRDAFSVLFFVSVGMLFDPSILIQQPLAVLMTVLIIIFGKSLAAFALVLAFRYPLNTALTVSASLAQIGEFSFILMGLSVALGLFSPENQSIILAGAIISIAVNPFVFKLANGIERLVKRRFRVARKLAMRADPLAELPMTTETKQLANHVVLVGHGCVGQRVAEALLQQNITVVVAEQNREQVTRLREAGVHAVAGDAAEAEVLVQAHVARAATLVIAIADIVRTRQMLEIARMLNPNIEILVRSNSDEEVSLLERESVNRVFFGEQELAHSIVQHILSQLRLKTHKLAMC